MKLTHFCFVFLGMFSVIQEGKEASVKFYNDWVDEVKKTVPKERLLIFSVKQGWEPLCQFLNLPQPSVPFPKSNDSGSINSLIQASKRQSYLGFFALTLPILMAFLALYYKLQIK